MSPVVCDNASPVSISFKEYQDGGRDFFVDIEAAFGKDGLGLIVIKDIPDFQKERLAVLNAIRKFANLPEEIKEKYADSKSNYNFGWSHGKEKMRTGVPDTAKGSYYANALSDSTTDDEKLKEREPEMYTDNIWPSEEDFPGLRGAFFDMTRIQLDVGYMMCDLFDHYMHKITDGKHEIGSILNRTKNAKLYSGRLLHYFPLEPQAHSQEDGLCGWHLDHGAATMLTCPIYFDLEGNEVPAPTDCGLHIKDPSGAIVKCCLPEDCIMVQLGESLQYLSGGHLRATPHCVKSSKTPNITRETLALFMGWHPDEPFTLPDYSLPLSNVLHTPHLPKGVPDLDSRVNGATTFSEFVVNTLKAYYS